MLKQGLYEQVLNKALTIQLEQELDKMPRFEAIDNEEAPKILAKYLAEIIEKELLQVKGDEEDKLQSQISFVNSIVDTIGSDGMSIDKRAEMIVAILNRQNSVFAIDEKAEIIRPSTSIAQSSLFTGAVHEPAMFTELKKEILSCDRIDMLVSFIKWSGLRLIFDELRTFTQKGGNLRIITTSYMGATDVKAVEELRQLANTTIKISYDTKRTRLHAKTYVFYRDTGYSTAYVGSSNLSNAAISSGLEWNVKVTAKDLPDTITKIDATFESYWNSSEFTDYSEEQKVRLIQALRAERFGNFGDMNTFNFDITPYPFQQEILDKLDAERKIRGYYRNLVVAATGTGKTVISAFDYKRFCEENKGRPNRFLFVAHREEILKQSIDCFRGVLKDANFGELFVGGYKPEGIDYLFISIQTFHSQEFYKKTTADYYDYIIVDEFHHSAAHTYQKLLTYYQPKILLGLTATPERMDGQSVIEYFGNRIAAEIRLPEAIDRKLLSPFQYFGVTDNVDLDDLKWTRGGYEKSALSNVYTGNDFRASMIIKAIIKYVTDLDEVKGLCFCVSKDHAEYMSVMFNKAGILSMFLTSDSPNDERITAKRRLINGEVRFIFVVDLYNEGVDIPEVNTILFLRPTESLTVFLQQLGRGLRLAKDKECLTVLDFIGQANRKYNFEDKFRALLENTTKSVQREVKDGFISLPKGCYIQLEKKAKEYILDNIRYAFGNRAGIITRIASFEEDTGKELSLEGFLEHYHLDIRTIYGKSSFSRLCVLADARDDFTEELEETLTKAMTKICAIDSRRWINFLLRVLPTTMYNDYSISESLFHWQSQSITTPESPTGQRYMNHKARGSKVVLFVRELKSDLAGTAPYTFLGLCDFVKNEGSRPMNITWKLQKKIPAKYLKKTNKLVVG